jgi:tetraacyldisaccharide 4'-kinase
LVIKGATQAIVVVDPDRVRAAEKAIELGAEVVLSDDGLQHLRLGRDYEIAVLDGARNLGNRRLLPAGPLRESASRLQKVNRRVFVYRGGHSWNAVGAAIASDAINAQAFLGTAQSLRSSDERTLSDFSGKPVHAIAGVGNPNAFFAMLREAGLQVIEHPFADHAALSHRDLSFNDGLPVLMTQKDAVRCRAFADERMWAVHMDLLVEPEGAGALLEDVHRIISQRSSSQLKVS